MATGIDALPTGLRLILRRAKDSVLFEPMVFIFRIGWLFYRELQEDKAFMRAAGMAYATLMALVPLLVLIFGFIGAFGFMKEPGDQQVVYDALFGTFFGDIVEIREALTPFIGNVDFRALGFASTIVLLFVTGRLFLMVESAYSDIFQVRVDRKFGRRILNFYFAITAVPTVAVLSIESMSRFSYFQLPFVSCLQFVLILSALKFFPCTNVRWSPALIGATTSWVLLAFGGRLSSFYIHWSYADPNYSLRAFYGSLILIPIFLLWLYMVWLILLLGVEVAHVAQNYSSLLDAEQEARERERGLRCPSLANAYEILARVAQRFEHGKGSTSLSQLRDETSLSNWDINAIAEALAAGGLFAVSDEGWIMARPPNQILLSDVAVLWRDLTGVGGTAEPIADELATLSAKGTLSEGIIRWLPEIQ